MDGIFATLLSLLSLTAKPGPPTDGNPFVDKRKARKLGSGGFGTVYKLGKLAYKVIICDDDEAVFAMESDCDLMNEATAGSSNVMAAQELKKEGRCLVMTACKGVVDGWLQRVYRRRVVCGPLFRSSTQGLKELQTLEIFEQMAMGVDACHRVGFLHGDIKLANFLMTKFPSGMSSHIEPGTVKLCDFGMAMRMEGQKTVMAMGGTEEFLAPEVPSSGKASLKADVYSLGMCLIDLFSCFSEEERFQSFVELLKNKGVWANVTPETKALIQGMLQHTPEDRLSTTEGLQQLQQHPILKDSRFAAAVDASSSRFWLKRRSSLVVPADF